MDPEYTTIESSDEGEDPWIGHSEEEADEAWNSDEDVSSRSVSDDADGDVPYPSALVEAAAEVVATRRSRVPVPRVVADASAQSELMEDNASVSLLHECMTSLLASVGGAQLLHDAQRRVGLRRAQSTKQLARVESEAFRTMWAHLSALRPTAASGDRSHVDCGAIDALQECNRIDVGEALRTLVAALRQLSTPTEAVVAPTPTAAVTPDDEASSSAESKLDVLRTLFEGLAQLASSATTSSVVPHTVLNEETNAGITAAPRAADNVNDDTTSTELAALRDVTATVTEVCRKESVESFRPLYEELLYLRQCVSTNRMEEQVLWAVKAFTAQRRLLEAELKHVEHDRRAMLSVSRIASCSEDGDGAVALASLEARLAKLCAIGKQLREEQAQLSLDLRALPVVAATTRTSTKMAADLDANHHSLVSTMVNEASEMKRQIADLSAKLRDAEARISVSEQQGGSIPPSMAVESPGLLEKLERSMGAARTEELHTLRHTMGVLLGRTILAVHTPLAAVGDVIVEVEDVDGQTKNIRVPLQRPSSRRVLDDTIAVPLAQALVARYDAAVKQHDAEAQARAALLKAAEAALALQRHAEEEERQALLRREGEEKMTAAPPPVAADMVGGGLMLDNPFADEDGADDDQPLAVKAESVLVDDEAVMQSDAPQESSRSDAPQESVRGFPTVDAVGAQCEAEAEAPVVPQPAESIVTVEPSSPVPTAASAAATESMLLGGVSRKRSRSPSPSERAASPRLERQPTNVTICPTNIEPSAPSSAADDRTVDVEQPTPVASQQEQAPTTVETVDCGDAPNGRDGAETKEAAHHSPPQEASDSLFAEEGFWEE